MIWFISEFGHLLTFVPSPLINFGMANYWHYLHWQTVEDYIPILDDYFIIREYNELNHRDRAAQMNIN